jgi:mycofactocin precursor
MASRSGPEEQTLHQDVGSPGGATTESLIEEISIDGMCGVY